jgi:hypothetical protein
MSDELRTNLIEVMKQACLKHTDTSPCYNRGFFKGYKEGFENALRAIRCELDSNSPDIEGAMKYWFDQSQSL